MTAHLEDPSVKLLKFEDGITLINLIQDGDESAYRQKVKELAVWCSLNNMELNTLKTVEMIVDSRRNHPALPPTHHHEQHCDCESIVKKAQLRKFNLPQELLKQFYSAFIESVISTSITVRFSSATKSDLRRLRSVVRTAEWIIGTTLPQSPRTVFIQSEKKGWQNHSGPLTSSTLPLRTVTVWSTLRSSEQQNDQTQKQFLPSIHPMNTWH